MPDSTGVLAPATNISSDQATSTRLRSAALVSEGGRSIRRAERPSDRFTQISNQWVRDKRLSWKARGVLTWLTSHAACFKVSEKTIICAAPDGRDAIRAAIRELEAYGYLLRERERGRDGTLGGVDYILCDPWSPQLDTTASTPGKGVVPASPAPENPPLATTSENTGKSQVATYDGKTNGGKSTPIRRTDKQEDQHPKKIRKDPLLLAVGERADRTAPALAVGRRAGHTAPGAVTTPPANPQELTRMAGDMLAKLPEHYRSAPAWLRSRLLKKISEALVHHAPLAVVNYCAKFADDPMFGDYEHLRRFDDVLRKLAADVADGTACPGCGRDPRHPFCTAASRVTTDEHAHDSRTRGVRIRSIWDRSSPVLVRRPGSPN